MIDFASEEKLPLEERFRLYARRLQLWRFCCNAACRRARSCRDPKPCCTRFADWSEEVKAAARREFIARDPQAQADLADLREKLARLARTFQKEG